MYFMIPNSEVGCYQGRFLSVPVPLVFSTGSDLDTKKNLTFQKYLKEF